MSAVALVAAAGTHLLPDWDEGRWWVLTIALGAIAVLAGAVGVWRAVAGLGEIHRHPASVTGASRAALGLVLASVLVVLSGVLVGTDWQDLDVPSAWDRVELLEGESALTTAVDGARRATAASGDGIRTRGRLGGCYEGSADEPAGEVPCAAPHTLELVGQVTVDVAEDAAPGERRAAAVDACDPVVAEAVGETEVDGDVVALVPDQLAWLGGDRGAVCVVELDEPREGALGG
ncbi:septum formation family protein [Iamia majanohamensis]|uniref:Septum formation family protein n=1 Tax=Iamia majanohamensis TaxID=467976 RepID=A0AAE9Y9C9_9ACTN|nr:septum formation family protein [Iamia majanohamensis]WCO69012.1 septum formation family protein [Iamia majanohamensis]